MLGFLQEVKTDTTSVLAPKVKIESWKPSSHLLLCVSLLLVHSSDVLSPAVVHLSDHGPHQIHVSWGPLQLARVQQYTVEYGAIPSSHVRTVTLPRQKNSTLLTGLEPGTQYLVTVTALQVDGKERAMSVRACTLAGTDIPSSSSSVPSLHWKLTFRSWYLKALLLFLNNCYL